MNTPFNREPRPDSRWVCCKEYRHWRTGKIMRAEDYGYKAWYFLAKKK